MRFPFDLAGRKEAFLVLPSGPGKSQSLLLLEPLTKALSSGSAMAPLRAVPIVKHLTVHA